MQIPCRGAGPALGGAGVGGVWSVPGAAVDAWQRRCRGGDSCREDDAGKKPMLPFARSPGNRPAGASPASWWHVAYVGTAWRKALRGLVVRAFTRLDSPGRRGDRAGAAHPVALRLSRFRECLHYPRVSLAMGEPGRRPGVAPPGDAPRAGQSRCDTAQVAGAGAYSRSTRQAATPSTNTRAVPRPANSSSTGWPSGQPPASYSRSASAITA